MDFASHILSLGSNRNEPLPKDPFIRDKFAQERSAKRFINYVPGIVGP
jgi:hypothetical protein